MAGPYGLWRDRSCTDLLLLLLFIAFTAGYIIVAAIAFASGNPQRLLYGTDFAGNTCGISPNPNQPSDGYLKTNLNGVPWSNRKYLWYPLIPNVDPKKFASMGVCLPGCPDGPSISLDGVDLTDEQTYRNYSKFIPTVTTYRTGNQSEVTYPVLVWTEVVLFRCVPRGTSNLAKGLAEQVTGFQPFVVGSAFLFRQILEVRNSWKVILICFACTLVIGFIYVFLLRFIVGPLLVITMLATIVLLALVGFLFWNQGTTIIKSVKLDERYKTGFKAAAIVVWVLDAILVLVVIFLMKNIRIAIEVIQMASRVFTSILSLIVVPPLFAIINFGVFVFAVAIWLYLKTSVQLQTVNLNLPIVGQNQTQQVMTTVVTQSRSKDWLILYDVFGFFWYSAFVHACSFFILALCGASWYFSQPGDTKNLPHLPILRSLWTILRYHIGTLAFGALVIAIIQFIRFLLSRIQKKLGKHSSMDAVTCFAKCLLCCINCCLAYWERVVAYISKNAYIVTAIEGSNFLSSAGTAVKLIVSNLFRLGTLSLVADFILFLSKLVITAAVVVIGWILLTKTSLGENTETIVLPLIVIGIMGFIVSTLFVSIYSSLADTLILCFCYDMENHNGESEPYFATSDLQSILGKYNVAKKEVPPVASSIPPHYFPNQQFHPPYNTPNEGNLYPSPYTSNRTSGEYQVYGAPQ